MIFTFQTMEVAKLCVETQEPLHVQKPPLNLEHVRARAYHINISLSNHLSPALHLQLTTPSGFKRE
jgi:hypothetical protein